MSQFAGEPPALSRPVEFHELAQLMREGRQIFTLDPGLGRQALPIFPRPEIFRPNLPTVPTVPAAPGATVDVLAPWLNALQFVSDDDIIQADQFNNLVKTVILLAQALDIEPPAIDQTRSFVPVLQPGGEEDFVSFVQILGASIGDAKQQGKDHQGWMSLDLPSGLRITSLKVLGSRATTPKSWLVKLLRRKVGQVNSEVVCSADIRGIATSGDVHSFVSAPIPPAPGGSADLTLVDPGSYSYFFETVAVEVPQPENLQLDLVQVTLTHA